MNVKCSTFHSPSQERVLVTNSTQAVRCGDEEKGTTITVILGHVVKPILRHL